MNREIFDQQITRLKTRWKNSFDPEFVSLLALKMAYVSNESFVETVNAFIGDRPVSQPPLLQDFIKATGASQRSSESRRYQLGEIRPKNLCECRDCGDSGFIRLSRKPQFEAWARYESGSAPCHCSNGRLVSQNTKYNLGPQFSRAWESSYQVVPTY